jgi:hypothetical protein
MMATVTRPPNAARRRSMFFSTGTWT